MPVNEILINVFDIELLVKKLIPKFIFLYTEYEKDMSLFYFTVFLLQAPLNTSK